MTEVIDTGAKSSTSRDLNGGFRPAHGGPGGIGNNLINVQPPRREDLQPAYAQTLQGESEDAGSHGWYGSMSKSLFSAFTATRFTNGLQSTTLDPASGSLEPSHAVSSARTRTNPSAKETSVS